MATLEEEPWDSDDAEEGDGEVESVADYLPQLLEAKYGKNWQSLLGSMLEDEEEVEHEDGIEAVAFEDEEEGGLKEQELRRLVMQQMQRDEEEGLELEQPLPPDEAALSLLEEGEKLEQWSVKDEEGSMVAGGEDGEDEEEDDDEDEVDLPASVELALSPLLSRFVEQREAQQLPQPFPSSEWQRVLLCAVRDEARFDELVGTFANLRVLLGANFDDIVPGEAPAKAHGGGMPLKPEALSVRHRALLRAQSVHNATGLGAVACATSAYLEAEGTRPASETLFDVEVDERLDEMLQRLKPQSSSNERAVIYAAAACFVTEGHVLHGYAKLSMPIEFAACKHTTMPLSAAIDKLFVRLSQALELKFVGSDSFEDFYAQQEELKSGKQHKRSAGALLLRQRILREATVLDLDILKVSSFLNHMVDVELMEACGDELAQRLEGTLPTKVVTVEATGLLPAVFVSKALGVPLVFARKSRQIGVSDSYQASYRSHTKATSQDLYVSTEYLNPGDRVLLVDDFLAGGATAGAMVRLCRMANAKVVGGGFLIEKLNDAGRAFLSGYQIPLEALCAVSIDNGNIVIEEDEAVPSWRK